MGAPVVVKLPTTEANPTAVIQLCSTVVATNGVDEALAVRWQPAPHLAAMMG